MFIYLHTTGGFYMQIQLSEHFTYKKLLRFVLPSIVMMIFTSIYGVVDGLFVSNYVGKTAFAAVNLIMPFLMAISALGFMIGTGGSAIVAKTLGEGKKEQRVQRLQLHSRLKQYRKTVTVWLPVPQHSVREHSLWQTQFQH